MNKRLEELTKAMDEYMESVVFPAADLTGEADPEYPFFSLEDLQYLTEGPEDDET
jgi:hypothetical protein